MRVFYCDKCSLQTRGTFRIDIAFCPRCGGAMEKGDEALPGGSAPSGACLSDKDIQEAHCRTCIEGAMAAFKMVDVAGGNVLDATVMAAGVFLVLCSQADVHPSQFLEAVQRFVWADADTSAPH